MNKPKPDDFDLTPALIKEITSYNRRAYRSAWVLTHVLSISIAVLVSILVKTSTANKLVIFGGIIAALYSLRYLYGLRLLTSIFIKPYHSTPRLAKFIESYKLYLS